MNRRSFLATAGITCASLALPAPGPDSFRAQDAHGHWYTFIQQPQGFWLCELYAEDVYPEMPMTCDGQDFAGICLADPAFGYAIVQHINPDDRSHWTLQPLEPAEFPAWPKFMCRIP